MEHAPDSKTGPHLIIEHGYFWFLNNPLLHKKEQLICDHNEEVMWSQSPPKLLFFFFFGGGIFASNSLLLKNYECIYNSIFYRCAQLVPGCTETSYSFNVCKFIEDILNAFILWQYGLRQCNFDPLRYPTEPYSLHFSIKHILAWLSPILLALLSLVKIL